MVGTLIRTMPQDEIFIGLVYDWSYDHEGDGTIVIEVKWNDCDDTTEIFHEYDSDHFDTSEYHFYHKGRWWLIDENFYKFKAVLEGKCR